MGQHKRGRKPKPPEQRRSDSFTVRCDSAFKSELERVAAIYGLDPSEYVRLIIQAQNEWATRNEATIKAFGLHPKIREAAIPADVLERLKKTLS